MIKQIAQRAINKNVETKSVLFTSTDGTEIAHNNFITLSNAVLATSQGVQDSPLASRIGDQITLRGVKMSMMVELNERYSDVTFRLLVVKCAKGDTPTRANLWMGNSGNKMIDKINTERYTILAGKTFKLRAANNGWTTADGAGGIPQPSGYGQGSVTYSRVSRIVKLWIPGKKFSRNGKIQYENNSSQPKFFDYHVLLYAYSNYTTLQDTWNVGRLNDYVQELYFKDA